MRLKSWEYGANLPAQLKTPGEWVIRKNTNTEAAMDALARFTSKQLGRTVRFVKIDQPVDCIVVKGTFHFSRLTPNQPEGWIDFVSVPSPGQPPLSRHTTLHVMLQNLENRISKPVIDQTTDPGQQVAWRDFIPNTEPALLVKNLAAQTSLTFEHQKRTMGVWTMIDSGPPVTRAASEPVSRP